MTTIRFSFALPAPSCPGAGVYLYPLPPPSLTTPSPSCADPCDNCCQPGVARPAKAYRLLPATHTGSEALGRSKDICLTQCAPVHTAHYSVPSAPNAHPETSAGSVPACTCPSPAPALPLHSIQPPAICMHARTSQLNLLLQESRPPGCAPRLAT